jgi:hypothetical protein
MRMQKCHSVVLTHKNGAVYHWRLPVTLLMDDGEQLVVEGDPPTDTMFWRAKRKKGFTTATAWDVRGLFSRLDPMPYTSPAFGPLSYAEHCQAGQQFTAMTEDPEG